MKLVLFGAGKTGRAFIGQLFSRAGYEVVFIDRDERLIEALNRERSYKVFVCDKRPETIVVENVRGVNVDNTAKVIEEIASAALLAVSIGKDHLPKIVSTLAEGLLKRELYHKNRALDIILAENMRNADIYMRNELAKILSHTYQLDKLVGLVETSIGKMTPLKDEKNSDEDILSVYTEAYNTLIVSRDGFKNPIPSVEGLEAKENMKAWVDRKLFIHNFGHAAVAYLGYLYNPEYVYTWEPLEDAPLREEIRDAMLQSAKALSTIHPGVFTDAQLDEHIADLLNRFANRSLGDTIFRVGCGLHRKLAPDDRIVAPLISAEQNQLPYNLIFKVLLAALQFKAKDKNGKMLPADIDFHNELEKKIIHIFSKPQRC